VNKKVYSYVFYVKKTHKPNQTLNFFFVFYFLFLRKPSPAKGGQRSCGWAGREAAAEPVGKKWVGSRELCGMK
jgi:hypothetical protein